MEIDNDKCSELVYRHGETLGVYDIPKEEANQEVKNLNAKEDGYVYDWHYFGGRVVLKRLSTVKLNEFLDNDKTKTITLGKYNLVTSTVNRIEDQPTDIVTKDGTKENPVVIDITNTLFRVWDGNRFETIREMSNSIINEPEQMIKVSVKVNGIEFSAILFIEDNAVKTKTMSVSLEANQILEHIAATMTGYVNSQPNCDMYGCVIKTTHHQILCNKHYNFSYKKLKGIDLYECESLIVKHGNESQMSKMSNDEIEKQLVLLNATDDGYVYSYDLNEHGVLFKRLSMVELKELMNG